MSPPNDSTRKDPPGGTGTTDDEQPRRVSPRLGWFSMPPMLYPTPYVWILFFSTLDVILTALILRFGGDPSQESPELEINPIARLVIEEWTMFGASLFKFGIVMLVIVACEVVGRHRVPLGTRLVWTCVVISAFPVVWSLTFLFINRFSFFDAAIKGTALTS